MCLLESKPQMAAFSACNGGIKQPQATKQHAVLTTFLPCCGAPYSAEASRFLVRLEQLLTSANAAQEGGAHKFHSFAAESLQVMVR